MWAAVAAVAIGAAALLFPPAPPPPPAHWPVVTRTIGGTVTTVQPEDLDRTP